MARCKMDVIAYSLIDLFKTQTIALMTSKMLAGNNVRE